MWIKASQFPWEKFPAFYGEWLQNPGSLTQRFRQLSQDVLSHQLFFEGWKNLSSQESEPLFLATGTSWVREIVFYGQHQAWEWARTIIPPSSLENEGKVFLHLGNKPIGDVLFNDPQLQRSEFEIDQLDINHPYTQTINKVLKINADEIWARRSIIYFYQKPLLIYECFLPAVFAVISSPEN